MTIFRGADDATAFTWAIYAYGLGQANAQGQNQLFPSGPGTKLPVPVPTADDMWREYFRYFLHYTGLNCLRIWIADYNWSTAAADLWRTNPTKFYEIFDRMTYWANRAGVSVIPILGTSPPVPFDISTAAYAAHVAFAKGVIAHGSASTAVIVWDLWNEPNVSLAPAALQTWGQKYIADVKPSSTKPVMIGTGNFVDFPNADWTSRHTYDLNENQAFLDAQKSVLNPNKVHFEGEVGYWSGLGIGYGYWPWYSSNAPWSTCAMVLLNNNKGAYADYPYFGALPDYPTLPSPLPPSPPPPDPGLTPMQQAQVQAMIDAAIVAIKIDTATKLAAALATHTHISSAISTRTGTP